MGNDHEVPSTAIPSPGEPEADPPGKKDIHDSAIEVGSTEDVASSVGVAESDTINLLESRFENLHDQGESGFQY